MDMVVMKIKLYKAQFCITSQRNNIRMLKELFDCQFIDIY